METSAKTGTNVEQAFLTIVADFKNRCGLLASQSKAHWQHWAALSLQYAWSVETPGADRQHPTAV